MSRNIKYSKEFILKVNEIYHDIEGKEYQNKHPEIFQDEASRWREIGNGFLNEKKNKQIILDLGTGTGFVPLNIAKFLKENDLFICSDISMNILDICMHNIKHQNFKCNFKFVKLDGKKIPLPSDSVNCITLNSVLHHIPDFDDFFKEVNRILQTNGYLIIGHEPNKLFYAHNFLWNNYKLVSALFDPKRIVAEILQKFRLMDFFMKLYGYFSSDVKSYRSLAKKVNIRLLEDKLIKKELSAHQIAEIVDIHSPTAGFYYHANRGIEMDRILSEYLPNFRLIYIETYNHLCKISNKNKFTKKYNNFLKKKYPEKGATFLVVLRKVN